MRLAAVKRSIARHSIRSFCHPADMPCDQARFSRASCLQTRRMLARSQIGSCVVAIFCRAGLAVVRRFISAIDRDR